MRISIILKLFLFFSLFSIIDYQVFAQAPESMNYQAVIRDGSGNIVASQSVGIRIDILQGSATGTSVYQETFTPTTNAYGSIAIQIGTGSVVSGTFSLIDWGANSYFVETAVDISGGTNYTVISTTQFVSVPYALYAKNSRLDSAGIQGMIDASGSGSVGGGSSTTNDFMWTNSTSIINESGTAYWSGNPPGNQQSWTVPSGYVWKIIRYTGSTSSLTADENGEYWLNESQSLTFKGNGSNGGTLSFSFMAWQYLKSEINFNILNYSGTGYWNNNPTGNQVSWTVPNGKLWKIKYTTGACQTSFGNGEKWLDEGQTISFTGNGSNGSTLAFSFMAFEYDK